MEDLVKKAKKGNEEAFSKLILAEKEGLYKIAISRMKTVEDAEDVIQETVIDAFIKIRKIKKHESFNSWIRSILINKINTFYERKAKKDFKIQTSIIESFENQEISANIIKTEQDMDFKRLLDKLEYQERIIILLFYNDRYKIKEISELLGINENTIKTKLFRARNKIRELRKAGEKFGSVR